MVRIDHLVADALLDEKVPPIEIVEDRVGIGIAADLCRRLHRHVGKTCGSHQKVARARRALVEDLTREIRENRVHCLRLRDMVHGPGSLEPFQHQDEPCRPSIRLVMQRAQRRLVQTRRVVADGRRFLQRMAEFVPS